MRPKEVPQTRYYYEPSYHIPDPSLSDLNKALGAPLSQSRQRLASPNHHVVEMLSQDPQHWCTSRFRILFTTMENGEQIVP